MNDDSERARVSSKTALSQPLEAGRSRSYSRPLVLFVITVFTVFRAGAMQEAGPDGAIRLLSGWKFAVPLLSILLAHEFGHFIAALLHSRACSSGRCSPSCSEMALTAS